jgi:hypothetical protein
MIAKRAKFISGYCKGVLSKKRKINFMSRQNFIFLLTILSLAVLFSPFERLKWVGATLCIFSAMANDSVQTLGTFLSSNSKTSWWKLFIFVGVLYSITMISGWIVTNGRLDFMRLKSIDYTPEHTIFHFLAPVILIVLTYNKIAVSSTFLILSVFAPQSTVGAMLLKTFIGYFVGLFFSYILWSFLINKTGQKLFTEPKKKKSWKILQWISSAVLWIAWLTNNSGNMVVFLPRVFSVYGLCLYLVIGLAMLAFVIYNRGGPIQEMVDTKCGMDSLKTTSVTNFLYAFIIMGVASLSPIPMATTWIFIGILAGQEMSMAPVLFDRIMTLKEKVITSWGSISKDVMLAGSGLLVSLIFALANSIYMSSIPVTIDSADIEIIVDNDTIEIEVDAPFIGFKKKPTSPKDRELLSQNIKKIKGEELFEFRQKAKCSLVNESFKEQYDEREVEFEFKYKCASADKLDILKINLFDKIPNLSEYRIQIINNLKNTRKQLFIRSEFGDDVYIDID